ncbi:MAG: putative Ig domain-containing protein, partial [Ekhidna sp.]|nr:putative Ig domain-containing protein [Ekhidna sp.]
MNCPNTLPTGVTCTDLNNVGIGNNPRVTFSGSAAGSATVVMLTLTATADTDVEAEGETVNLNPGTPVSSGMSGGAAPTTDNFGEFSIHDVVVSLSISGDGTVTEGDPPLTLTAARSEANNTSAALSIPIRIKTASTTAQAGDYIVAGSISIAGGAAAGTIDFEVTDDGADEPAETVVIELGMLPAGNERGATPEVEITITDNDPTKVVFTMPDATATEGSSDDLATLRLTLGRALRAEERLEVPLSFSGGILGTDFTLSLSDSPSGVMLSGSVVTFSGSSGESAVIAEVLLSASEDSDTADETVVVSIPSSTMSTPRLTATVLEGGARGSRTGDGRIKLKDDDVPPPDKPAGFTAMAGDEQITLNWTNPVNSNITSYQFRQKSGSGNYSSWIDIAGSDVATVSHTVTGLTNGTVHTLRIRAVAGSTNGVPSDERMATPQAAPVNSVPAMMVMIPDQTATVGAAFRYTFPANTFSDADGDELTYTAAQGDGSALPGWLAFNTNSRTFSGMPQEGDEGTLSIKVTASDGNGGSVSDSFDIIVSATASVQPVVTIATGTSPVTEGIEAAFTVTAAPAPMANLTVSLSVTEAAGSDFVASGDEGTKTVVIPTSGSATYTVATVNDDTDEENGSMMATVADGSGYTVGTPSEASVTVNDNDEEEAPLGAEDAAEVVIFPNPSGRYLEVRSSIEGTFQLLSLSGKPLLEGTTNTRVDIFSLKSGLYLVQLPDGRLLKFVRE